VGLLDQDRRNLVVQSRSQNFHSSSARNCWKRTPSASNASSASAIDSDADHGNEFPD
jgi:hypothetical protein